MSHVSREVLMNAAFVKLADTLVDDFEMHDLLRTLVESCTQIFDTQAGGLMLVGVDGNLELAASTSEPANLVEIMQLNAGAGPCLDSFTSGEPVAVSDIDTGALQWPEFRSEALKQGFRSIYAAPMRLRGEIIGTLNLLGTHVGSLTERDSKAVQALADAATIGILQQRLIRENERTTEQLNRALTTRIFIEQAKGVLSESNAISMDSAFMLLRAYSRDNNQPLQAVAEAVADRSLRIDAA